MLLHVQELNNKWETTMYHNIAVPVDQAHTDKSILLVR